MIERLQPALADRYRIGGELGAGGMATVYLATDLKHNRQVALKVLRPELSAILGGERFLKEIELTANLQHPHLLPLFDSGSADGHLYYVMPYVAGESLRARLLRERQLGVDEALRITLQVASALDYAHRHGVLHRDIKPENILLHEGEALIADFGIALAVRQAGGTRLTETGLSLGTPQYMSPEQASGDRQLDARTDVYSLACVLYEMLAGEPPHSGPTHQAVIAKVLVDRARNVIELRSTVPPHVAAALEVALAKLPADRFASAGEFAAALQGRGIKLPRAARAQPKSGPASWQRDPRTLALGGIALLSLVALAVSLSKSGSAGTAGITGPIDFQIPPPPGYAFDVGGTYALSPDGRMIAFLARGDTNRLFLRTTGDATPRPIAAIFGPNDALAFAPDGRSIVYAEGAEVYRVPVSGGPPEKVGTAPSWVDILGWLATDTIVGRGASGGLWELDLKAGTVSPLTISDSAHGEDVHDLPIITLPDGKRVFTVLTRSGRRMATLGSGPFGHSLLSGDVNGYLRGAIPGYLIIEKDEQLGGETVAVPIDQHGVPTGEPIVIERKGRRVFLSPAGTLLRARVVPSVSLAWVAREGTIQPAGTEPSRYTWPRLSPDGRSVAIEDRSRGIITADLATGRTITLGEGGEPVWSPDGKEVAFWTSTGGGFRLMKRRADASAPAAPVGPDSLDLNATSWSRDGRTIFVSRFDASRGGDYDVGAIGFDGRFRLLAGGPGFQRGAMVSPDGRWVAYSSTEGGRSEVYVTDWPGAQRKWAVSSGGGFDPVWSRDGRELYYLRGSRVMEVSVGPGVEPTFSAARIRYSGPFYLNPTGDQSYDVGPDGRLLMLFPTSDVSNEVRVTLNWSPSPAAHRR